MTDPPAAKYVFALYRGDTRVWEHHFHESPPAWAPSTAYTAGTVGSSEYIAGTAVTFGVDRKGVPVKYTCTTAHTSDTTFDSSKWAIDRSAVGAPIDITGWIFESTYRQTTESADDVAIEDCEVIDGPGGVMRRTLIAEQAALLPAGTVAWDMQATKADGTIKTYLYNDGVKVTGDVTR